MAQIRRAQVEDWTTMCPLIAAYWQFESIPGFDPARIGPQLERLLSSPNLGAGWIALDDEQAVGYLLAVYVFSLEHAGLTAEIDEFFVLPNHGAVGIGSELIREAEAEFFRVGCTNVSLQLSRDNASARRFYLKFGYRERSGFELLDKMLRDDQESRSFRRFS